MTTEQQTLGATDLRARERVEAAYRRLADGTAKLEEKFKECRLGPVSVEGQELMAFKSLLVPDMHYFVDRATASFWRSYSPDTPARFTACSPREVIREDREWLFPMLQRIPAGQECLRRYATGEGRGRDGAAAPAATPEPSRALLGALAGVEPRTERKRTVIVEESSTILLQPVHVAALLRASGIAGLVVPEDAEVRLSVGEDGFLSVSWKTEQWTE